MSHRPLDSPTVAGRQTAAEPERITNNPHAMASDNTEDATEPNDPVGAVLDVPELLGMVLSHLSTRDLARSLSVSKRWNGITLYSMDLRRTLFLEPAPVKEHLEFKHRRELNVSRYLKTPVEKWSVLPVVIYGPSQNGKTVFEPHPIIAPGCDPEPSRRSNQQIYDLSLERLKTVSPSTLLFQPPLKNKDIRVQCGHLRITTLSEVTFGAIVQGYEQVRVLVEKFVSCKHCPDPELYSQFLDGTYDSISITVGGALASNSDLVKIAREAME